LESPQKYIVDKVQENILNDIHFNLEGNFLTTKNFRSKVKNSNTGQNQQINLKGEFTTLFQTQTMNKERTCACPLLYHDKIEVNEKYFLVDITNEPHPNLQQNIPSFTLSAPCSLNFQKIKCHDWKFDDIPSQVAMEIRNVNDKIEMNYECDELNDHNIIISQKIMEKIGSHLHDEQIEHVTIMESNCKDLKKIKDKSITCISNESTIKDEKLKDDYFAHLECDLMNRMNYNFYPGHQQVGAFNAICNKHYQDNFMTSFDDSNVT